MWGHCLRIEIKDYVVLPRGQGNGLTLRPLILDFTMTDDRYGKSRLHPNGLVTHTRSSDGVRHPDVWDLTSL